MHDKNEFIRDLMPIAEEFEGDYDWDAIANEVGEYDATHGWHLRESIAEDMDEIGFSHELDEAIMRHDLNDPENQPEIRCILFDDDEERSLYHVRYNIDGDSYETVAVCKYVTVPDPDMPWDWEDKPKTLEECDHIKWLSCSDWLSDPSTPLEARAVIHAVIEQLGE